jgi:hypothetical protein
MREPLDNQNITPNVAMVPRAKIDEYFHGQGSPNKQYKEKLNEIQRMILKIKLRQTPVEMSHSYRFQKAKKVMHD